MAEKRGSIIQFKNSKKEVYDLPLKETGIRFRKAGTFEKKFMLFLLFSFIFHAFFIGYVSLSIQKGEERPAKMASVIYPVKVIFIKASIPAQVSKRKHKIVKSKPLRVVGIEKPTKKITTQKTRPARSKVKPSLTPVVIAQEIPRINLKASFIKRKPERRINRSKHAMLKMPDSYPAAKIAHTSNPRPFPPKIAPQKQKEPPRRQIRHSKAKQARLIPIQKHAKNKRDLQQHRVQTAMNKGPTGPEREIPGMSNPLPSTPVKTSGTIPVLPGIPSIEKSNSNSGVDEKLKNTAPAVKKHGEESNSTPPDKASTGIAAISEGKKSGEAQGKSDLSGDELKRKLAIYRGIIACKIERVKAYPREARQERQEGRVVISFMVNPSGDIDKVNVIRSSGFHLLDEAATQAAGDGSPYLPFPEGLNRPIRIKMTVNFRLSLTFLFSGRKPGKERIEPALYFCEFNLPSSIPSKTAGGSGRPATRIMSNQIHGSIMKVELI